LHLKPRSNFFINILIDYITSVISVYLALYLRFGFIRALPKQYTDYQFNVIIVAFLLFSSFCVLTSVYKTDIKTRTMPFFMRTAAAGLLTAFALIITDRSLKIGAPFEIIIILALLLVVNSSIIRLGVWYFNTLYLYTQIKNKGGKKRAIIYGAGELGEYFVSTLKTSPHYKLIAAGFIDDNSKLTGKNIGGLPVLGKFGSIEQIVRQQQADTLVLAINNMPVERLKETVKKARQLNLELLKFGLTSEVDNISSARLGHINLEDLLRRNSVSLNMRIVSEMLCGKTVMVTGGAGSIGSEICRQVLRFGAAELIIFDINENELFHLDRELSRSFDKERYHLCVGSVRDKHRLDELMQQYRPEIVLHAAAHKHVPMMEINPQEAVKNNVFGTLNTAECAIQNSVKNFILISTDKAVNPANIMGATKRIAEIIIQLLDNVSDTTFSAVRFGNVLGSVGSVVPIFKEQIERGGPVTVTHPEMKRYFMTIPEAVELVLEAAAMSKGGEIFVLDMGEPVYILDLAKDIIRLYGLEPDKDIKIEFTGLRPGEKLYEEISLAEENTTKTKNDKIYINNPIEHNYSEIGSNIKLLRESVENGNICEMYGIIKRLVPTFENKSSCNL